MGRFIKKMNNLCKSMLYMEKPRKYNREARGKGPVQFPLPDTVDTTRWKRTGMETGNNSTEQTATGGAPHKSRTRLYIALACVLIVGAVVAGIFIAKAAEQRRQEEEAQRLAIINSGVFHDGIVVEGVSLGGKTMEEALPALKEAEAAISSGIRLTLTAGDTSRVVDAALFKPAFNTAAVLEEAMAVGRSGSLDDLLALLEELAATPRTFQIDYTVDTDSIRAYVGALAEELNVAPQDAHFAVLIDKDALTEEERKSEEYIIKAASTTHEERMSYVQEADGRILDEDALYAALAGMGETKSYSDMEIPFETVKADITLDNIESKIVLRASASTSFAKSPYNRATRVFNIQKAVSLINGTMLMPDEVFSTNGTLGNRTYAGGWKAAPAIVRGRSEDQAGGGVCQVSSTLYNCVLKADLEIVYRQGHSGRLSYIGGGLDATIDSGRIDFKWKNSTASPLYIFAWVDTSDKTLHFEIYGEPLPDEYDTIELSSKRVQTLSPPGETVYTVDYTKPTGYKQVYVERKSGSIWESYATYKKDGEVVKTVTIARTTYRAYAGETIIGPPAATAPSTPNNGGTYYPYPTNPS